MRKVLLVDDSASTRALVRAILEEATFSDALDGCEVIEATSGFDAMRLLPRGPYDLIITDINMADINGLELIKFVRGSEHHKRTPVLIVSTLAAQKDVDRGLALGANAYLTKPFKPDQLCATCVKLFEPRA